MKIAVLFSGGKDSTLAMYKAKQQGHDIKYLVSIFPTSRESMMFHYSTELLLKKQAEALGVEIKIKNADSDEKELEVLEQTLAELDIEGVVSGAVASNYQKDRIEAICKKLNLENIVPLWNMDQEQELIELLDNDFDVMITSVSAAGFTEDWLGRKINVNCIDDLKKISEKYKINMNGEGGEYCTTVINCPLFSKPIKITKFRKVWQGDRGYLEIEEVE